MKKKHVYILFVAICAIIVNSVNVFTNSALEAPELEIQPSPEEIQETITLYFRCPVEAILVEELRVIERTFESRAEVVLRELIKGPANSILHPTLSPRTKIYSVLTIGDTVYVNFSKEFYTDLPRRELDEVLVAFSVVNSLTKSDYISKVQILIEGERPHVFLKHLSLREPLVRNEKITKETLASPLDVLRSYFKHLENQEIRRAFDYTYRTPEFGLDYSMFFRKTRDKIENFKNIEIKTFVISYSSEGITLTVDYVVELTSGEFITHEKEVFEFRNHFGEWKIFKRNKL